MATMATAEDVGSSYNDVAVGYKNAWQEEIPVIVLENELVDCALGDCTGFRILDLAGGSGGHARRAIQAGAALIDLVDISDGMLGVGRKIEEEAGRNIIHWHQADIIPPLSQQVPALPPQGYDLVMAMWPLDHCHSLKELEGMWRNIATYLKPNGKLIAIRVGNPYAQSAKAGKYGVKFSEIEPIPDGVKYNFTICTDPPFTLEASSMETSYSGSDELPEKFGITDYKVLDTSKTNTVKADPQFWEEFSNDPHFVVFTARKK